jgi:hypothetical protein
LAPKFHTIRYNSSPVENFSHMHVIKKSPSHNCRWLIAQVIILCEISEKCNIVTIHKAYHSFEGVSPIWIKIILLLLNLTVVNWYRAHRVDQG